MELTRYQKILLAALAGMLVFFSVLMAVFRSSPGVLFEGSLLKITEYGDRTVYSGKAHGTAVSISVEPFPEDDAITDVIFAIPGVTNEKFSVAYPLGPIQTEWGPVPLIQVKKNGAVVFRGGYDPENELGWYDEEGEWIPQFAVGAVYGSDEADSWQGYETDVPTAVRFALGPGTAAHGDPGLFALAVFLTALLAVWIRFHKQLFRFEHRWARDPEPTEGYLFLERAVWLLAAAAVAGVYLAAMVTVS